MKLLCIGDSEDALFRGKITFGKIYNVRKFKNFNYFTVLDDTECWNVYPAELFANLQNTRDYILSDLIVDKK